MSIQNVTVKIFKYACAQDLAVWMQRRGWLLSVLSLEGRMIWLQATRDGQRIEAEVRGVGDVPNACGVLMAAVAKADDRAARTAA